VKVTENVELAGAENSTVTLRRGGWFSFIRHLNFSEFFICKEV
jgi:hypothetical protein